MFIVFAGFKLQGLCQAKQYKFIQQLDAFDKPVMLL
jgi:hypothetical protein